MLRLTLTFFNNTDNCTGKKNMMMINTPVDDYISYCEIPKDKKTIGITMTRRQ